MSEAIRIVIIGRPNVGKSTLFNRLLGRRRALVHDEPGVTRDRLEERTEWWHGGERYAVTLVDTGGLGGDRFAEEIDRQVRMALEEAHVVMMLFDGQAGLIPADEDVLKRLKRSGLLDSETPVLGVVNKVDANVHEDMLHDFFASGLDPILTISAEHNRGIDELKQAVLELSGAGPLPEETEEDGEKAVRPEEPPRIAVVGRPNVGKSTFVNALLGKERMITSNIAGTTVDAIDSTVMMNGKPFVFIDTAGIRRKSKTEEGVEVLSVVQARKALERCDVAFLLLDGEKGLTEQDEKIGGLIEEVGCGVALIMNKWDTQERNREFSKDDAAERIRKQMAYLRYAPIVFVSAKHGKGIGHLDELVEEILRQRQVKVQTHEFTEWVRAEATIHNPLNAKFYMCHQSGRHPPTFVFHVSDPEKVHFSLRRHLANGIRERWGYMGNPIRLHFVKGKSAANRPAKPSKNKSKAKPKRPTR